MNPYLSMDEYAKLKRRRRLVSKASRFKNVLLASVAAIVVGVNVDLVVTLVNSGVI